MLVDAEELHLSVRTHFLTTRFNKWYFFCLLLIGMVACACSAQTTFCSSPATNNQSPLHASPIDPTSCGRANPPSWCSGTTDFGDWVNSAIAYLGNVGTIEIPDGVYTYKTPICISQSQWQTMTIHCSSQSAQLQYTGSGAAAIEITQNTNSAGQVAIDNCWFNGASNSNMVNGIYLYDSQRVRLNNVFVYGFKNYNLLATGAIGTVSIGSDFSAPGAWNVVLQPDSQHMFASNNNHFIGGSMQYGPAGNFWDAGLVTFEDENNTLDGVAMEETATVPQFIIEQTTGDSITNSYIEYAVSPAIADLSLGYVGNNSGTGIGQNANLTANSFVFHHNYLALPASAGGHTMSFLTMANSAWAHVDDNSSYSSAQRYAIVFAPSGTNFADTVGKNQWGWVTSQYENVPAGYNDLYPGAPGTATNTNLATH